MVRKTLQFLGIRIYILRLKLQFAVLSMNHGLLAQKTGFCQVMFF